MNALRPTIFRATATQFARSKATLAARPGAVPPQMKYSFKKQWLSDPSTYPIIVVMSAGLCFLVGMSCNALFSYEDVQISPSKRCATLANWDTSDRTPVAKRVAMAMGGVNPEGRGVDHSKWAKQRDAYMSE